MWKKQICNTKKVTVERKFLNLKFTVGTCGTNGGEEERV
jgi:hypothetical protein